MATVGRPQGTQAEIVGTPHGHRTGSVRFPLKACEYPTISIRFSYDLRTVLPQSVDKSARKKSCDARMNRKHIHRGPRSHTMPKNLKGKSQTEKLYDVP